MATLPLPPVMNGGVVVASSDTALREQLISSLDRQFPVLAADGGADALGKLENSECDVLLLDRELPDLDCEELIKLVEQQYPGVSVLRLDPKTRNVMGSPKRWTPGVTDLFQVLERLSGISNDLPTKQEALNDDVEQCPKPLPGMVGEAPPMQELYRMVRLVAPRSTTVLITGPTGSGKELVARAVHELSSRAAKPFVVINCAAIPEALLEAELFGYTRGAFTGAIQSRPGRIQSAQGGTLFLDEIGELPLGLQAKLLRFLERGEVQRLGSSDIIRVDVRVVAATNADLLHRVEKGDFREDLYYRLSVFPIELPALVERTEDIRPLAEHFLKVLSPDRVPKLNQEALRKLEAHAWPGNVRELMHVLERALIISAGAPMLLPEHIHFAPVCIRTPLLSPRKGPVSA